PPAPPQPLSGSVTRMMIANRLSQVKPLRGGQTCGSRGHERACNLPLLLQRTVNGMAERARVASPYPSARGQRDNQSQKGARQESNLQPPVLERTPSNAGVGPLVDSQGLTSERGTPASLDDAGVGTNPGTEEHLEGRLAREVTDSKAGRARPLPQRNRGFLIERMRSLNTTR